MPQTLEEIRAAYPREWVLIVDCEDDDDSGQLVAGTVLVHSPHRRDVYVRLAEYKGKDCAVRYTGPVPQDQLYLL